MFQKNCAKKSKKTYSGTDIQHSSKSCDLTLMTYAWNSLPLRKLCIFQKYNFGNVFRRWIGVVKIKTVSLIFENETRKRSSTTATTGAIV